MEWWVILIIAYIIMAMVLAVIRPFRYSIFQIFRIFIEPPSVQSSTTYAEKMQELTKRLVESSRAVDKILLEMSEANQRQEIILNQQVNKIKTLSSDEERLHKRIETLKKIPLPAAEYFSELNKNLQKEQEKKRATRDYFLIISSAVLSALLTIVIMFIFN